LPSGTDADSLPVRDEPYDGYAVVSTSTPFRSGHVIDVRTDHVRMPDGGTASRDVVVHPGAVAIIALDDEGRVLLQRQYRHPVRRQLWEPPAGLLDEPGEPALAAAKRELYEEAHLVAERWDVLVDAFTSPGMTDEAVRVYLARGIRESDRARHESVDEELDLVPRWLPLDEAVDAVLAGRLHNPLAVMGLLAASSLLGAGREPRPADAPWPEASDFTGSVAEEAS
jgi:8-oxo-dGDP phosphatase